jgi:CheY-like chemotaxis protein/nitrogen-specific signal transduction histidine kinase
MKALDGTPIGTRGVTVDITDRMRLESERQDLLVSERDARQQAEEVNRVKDEFLMTLSHELRTPLNAIYGWARLLRQSHPDEAMLARGLAIIERNAEIQTQLVSDLLDVSRVITGKLRLDLRECDPVVAVNAAVDAIRPSADAKRITLTTIVPTSPVSMLVDPERLQQVVWNLLANAVKFTPREGSVRIEVERRRESLEIEVIDTGEGIAPEALPFIFERFRQGRTGTTRTHAGLGLGLSIARHFVELHGGSITATSSGEGCGSTFRVVLPVAARPPRVVGPLPLAPMVPSAITASSSGARLDGVTVLVVDDQEDGRELLALVLKRAGADVQTAASSAEAMALLNLWHPEILVLDIEMPREDGYALLGRVRAFEHVRGRRQSTAVAVTAHARQEDRARALAVGFDLHLAKPIDPTELIGLIAARRERQIEHERANAPTIDPAQPG